MHILRFLQNVGLVLVQKPSHSGIKLKLSGSAAGVETAVLSCGGSVRLELLSSVSAADSGAASLLLRSSTLISIICEFEDVDAAAVGSTVVVIGFIGTACSEWFTSEETTLASDE